MGYTLLASSLNDIPIITVFSKYHIFARLAKYKAVNVRMNFFSFWRSTGLSSNTILTIYLRQTMRYMVQDGTLKDIFIITVLCKMSYSRQAS